MRTIVQYFRYFAQANVSTGKGELSRNNRLKVKLFVQPTMPVQAMPIVRPAEGAEGVGVGARQRVEASLGSIGR